MTRRSARAPLIAEGRGLRGATGGFISRGDADIGEQRERMTQVSRGPTITDPHPTRTRATLLFLVIPGPVVSFVLDRGPQTA
jgi:hypothetical protein